MALPSDLAAHYSSKAFQTRLSALTAVGAVMAVSFEWIEGAEQSNWVGLVPILVVGSLAELNRRFTYSYLSACYAAARTENTEAWGIFRTVNEGPYRASRRMRRGVRFLSYLRRFMLSWSTYFPGLLVGIYLIFRDRPTRPGVFGTALASWLFLWWVFSSLKPLRPGAYAPRRSKKAHAGQSAT
jgi:hypothetical protein